MHFEASMLRFLLLWLLVFCTAFSSSSARPPPFAMRISCGARDNVHTPPTNTLWYKDFAYTGGIPANATRTSFITPPLKTLRYFPLSGGPENCYNLNNVPKGHYSVRMFFGLVNQTNFDSEPLFDVSVEGTQICSLQSGWSTQDEKAFAEAIVFLLDGTASFCFHSTGHGDPTILSIEILQVDENAYYFGPQWGQGIVLRTATRLSCGTGQSKFGTDYSGDVWGGDRFWKFMKTFGQNSDRPRSTESSIKQASLSPNFYPEEIDSSVTGVGQRVFDILINSDVTFQDVDVIKMSGGRYAALVLNTTVAISGRTLTITLKPKSGSHAIINAIEVFEVIIAESKTSPEEVIALQTLKNALSLPLRLGWNGDPCVPQEHPWSGADCHFDSNSSKWFIDGLGLDNQGLRGFLPDDISKLSHLQSINLSGNMIHGAIPSSLGTIASLEILDLSYNFFNGSIPESLGQLTSLQILNLNGNSLSGRVPAALGGRLLHRASFNFTDNAGLCGIPGLRTCGPHLSAGAKVGIALGALLLLLLIGICSMCWWKRRQNILRAQQLAARDAPYAKARTHLSRDIQMTRPHNNYGHSRTAAENGPSLLS
ncbi:hypothetical protein CMV_007737 [Castanea mollissima]|uniref:Uncharacterized protein n=1 Tax=Castanea mollissima TaxID=60419 RepID=A0A8J4R9N4_9ROSI|nr:hypothetical protein CMV_007737 [Castanea mollissima]